MNHYNSDSLCQGGGMGLKMGEKGTPTLPVVFYPFFFFLSKRRRMLETNLIKSSLEPKSKYDYNHQLWVLSTCVRSIIFHTLLIFLVSQNKTGNISLPVPKWISFSYMLINPLITWIIQLKLTKIIGFPLVISWNIVHSI